MPTHRVLFDSDAFIRHTRSGITRYFSELIRAYDADAELGVQPITPYKFVANRHLTHANPGRFTAVPLPRQTRPRVLEAMNRRRRGALGRVDLTHHSLYERGGFEAWPAARHVCTVYDFTHEKFPELFPDAGPGLAAKESYLNNCDLLIAISETTAADLRHHHPDNKTPVVVAPLGVSDEFFSTTRVPLRRLPERYVLYVGARHVHKNVGLLLRAFALVARHDPDLKLVLSGVGPPDETQQLAELGIADRTVRLRLTDSELPRAYANAQAFVFPSIYEGFGLPVIEAMATGCPTIVSSAPALLEVTDGAAQVVEPDDADHLAETLMRVLASESLRTTLRDAGRTRGRDFTWHRTAELTAKAYSIAITST